MNDRLYSVYYFDDNFEFSTLGHGKHPGKGHGKSWNFIRSKEYEPYNNVQGICKIALSDTMYSDKPNYELIRLVCITLVKFSLHTYCNFSRCLLNFRQLGRM